MDWASRAKNEFAVSSIDLSSLEAFEGYTDDGGQPLISTLLGLYLENSPKEFMQMDAAVKAKVPLKIHQIAHGLKSTSASLGALALADLCQKIETQSDAEGDATLDGLDETFRELELEFHKVMRDLAVIHQLVLKKPVPAGL